MKEDYCFFTRMLDVEQNVCRTGLFPNDLAERLYMVALELDRNEPLGLLVHEAWKTFLSELDEELCD